MKKGLFGFFFLVYLYSTLYKKTYKIRYKVFKSSKRVIHHLQCSASSADCCSPGPPPSRSRTMWCSPGSWSSWYDPVLWSWWSGPLEQLGLNITATESITLPETNISQRLHYLIISWSRILLLIIRMRIVPFYLLSELILLRRFAICCQQKRNRCWEMKNNNTGEKLFMSHEMLLSDVLLVKGINDATLAVM